jgi:polyhydroxybutyrate depolymerase
MMKRLVPLAFLPLCWLAACSDADSSSDASTTPPFTGVPPGTESNSEANAATPDGPEAPAAGTPTPNTEGSPPVAGGVEVPANEGAATPAATDPETPVTPPPAEATPPETAPPTDMPPPITTTPGEQNSPTPITPSAGCASGNASPATGQLSLTIRGAQANYLVTLPPGYSGSSPMPLIFGFHGRNRTFLEFEQVDASQIRTQLENRAVMVFPQSQGGPGWNFAAEVPPSVEFFDALYTQVLANYCVDTSHVFAVGHSSGGYFSHILACRYGEKLRGIGVVSGQLQEDNCTGNVAAIMIHSPGDVVVPFVGGVAARDYLIARNACTQATVPGPVAPCVTYQGCTDGLPVAWCQHNEPTYQDQGRDTFHGWPSFASQAMSQFLFGLP